eukprot:6184426-Pleurochrysis_carterae.AAC.1
MEKAGGRGGDSQLAYGVGATTGSVGLLKKSKRRGLDAWLGLRGSRMVSEPCDFIWLPSDPLVAWIHTQGRLRTQSWLPARHSRDVCFDRSDIKSVRAYAHHVMHEPP